MPTKTLDINKLKLPAPQKVNTKELEENLRAIFNKSNFLNPDKPFSWEVVSTIWSSKTLVSLELKEMLTGAQMEQINKNFKISFINPSMTTGFRKQPFIKLVLEPISSHTSLKERAKERM